MVDRDEVCVLIPTYNEAAAIGEVIERFLAVGYENVLVIDGGSTDGTRDIAEEAGAHVVVQSGEGKGQAVREAVDMIDAPYVLMVDGDATYRPEQADRMIEPLQEGTAEHVIGDRFADMQDGAMTRLNQVGNRIINRVFSVVHGRDLQDILSGYRAFTTDSFGRLSLSADGFGIETELAVECVRHDIKTAVVPITYESRPEGSETNLRPFRDGGNILLTLYRLAKKNNPIFYFGSIGVLSGLIGVGLAVFVLYSWIVVGISREVIALASGVALLFGLQLVMFGVLSDLIVTANRQQRRQFQRIERRLDRLEPDDGAEPSGTARPPGEETVAVSEDGTED
ncbi:S-layer glycoprotein N-glycosyltransferase AglJ [Halovenus sp. WSH3]|uniref:S-layer glycoprotein N-glycosyltransferase AglJ n=1 Tax=Halovenus carboxidivorans TaxID=2692199 RepID=A0A6B0TBE5_9EURY|nr:S-layer glycoprotein N-glycosyltransferase AglJ [Halovenus carboxidivorans]MXR52692.1 S-layer glycoprotein N-glycosyltransferase AglJ [Halovenus carboxidivorans]